MISKEAAQLFMASSWLSEMDQSARQAIMGILDEHRAEPGTILLAASRVNERIAFLLEGELVVTRNKEVLATISAPSMFGLTTFFRSTPPYYTAKATKPVWYLSLDRTAYERLRRENPRVAEQLALAVVHVLSDRLEAIDRRMSDALDEPSKSSKVTEWSTFRTRLFEESSF